MNALLLVFLLLAADDSPLVKAAKAAGGPRKHAGKVITNNDVKKAANKSRGGQAPSLVPSEAEQAVTKGPLEKQEEQRRARVAATERVANAEKKAAELEAELRRLEQAYYEESDLNRRDKVLVPRFEQTRKQLDEAKAELAAARDALSRLQ